MLWTLFFVLLSFFAIIGVMEFVICIIEIVSAWSSAVSSYFCAYSQALFITATGVRSSCEASAVKRFSASKESSSLPNISSKFSARRENSSFPAGKPILPERSLASFIASAVAFILSSGLKEPFMINQLPSAARMVNTGRVIAETISRYRARYITSGTSVSPRIHTPFSQS
jgi:hypothetical protein